MNIRKYTLLYIAVLALCFTSCHDDSDDYFTQAEVVISAPDSVSIDKLQGTVTVQNLNSGLSSSTSAFNGQKVCLQLLRGVYSISAEGTVRYHTPSGSIRNSHFRASSSYTEFLTGVATDTVDIILMQ